jgi:hypothetical protein
MRKRKREPTMPLPMLEIPIDEQVNDDEVRLMRSYYGSPNGAKKKNIEEENTRKLVKAIA